MERLRGLKESAERVGISPFTLRRWARLGRVASVRLSKKAIRFRDADIDQLIKTHLAPAREAE